MDLLVVTWSQQRTKDLLSRITFEVFCLEVQVVLTLLIIPWKLNFLLPTRLIPTWNHQPTKIQADGCVFTQFDHRSFFDSELLHAPHWAQKDHWPFGQILRPVLNIQKPKVTIEGFIESLRFSRLFSIIIVIIITCSFFNPILSWKGTAICDLFSLSWKSIFPRTRA